MGIFKIKYMARLTFLVSLLASLTGKAQKKDKEILDLINTAKADNKNFYCEIPFDFRNGWIVIKVKIGKDTYDYIFDTGGYNNITTEIAGRNNFPVLTTQVVGSANGIKNNFDIVQVDSLQIGEMVFRNIAALKFPELPPTMKCTINGALIGASIIKNYIWQIDYPRRKIIVTDQPAKITGLENAIRIPVTFNKRLMPYINAKFNGRTETIMFDLGSSSSFTMTEKKARRYCKDKKVIEIVGSGSEGGNGLLRETVKIMNIDSVQIGPLQLKDQPVVFTPSVQELLIGAPIIKQYIITLRFADNELYFSPIPRKDTTQGMESFGLALEYKEGKVVVGSLYKGLPADRAGLQLDDEIKNINGKAPHFKDYCECRNYMYEFLRTQNNITLSVLRNGHEQTMSLKKEKAF